MASLWTDLSHTYHSNIPPTRVRPELDMVIETLREVDEDQGHANVQRLTIGSHQGTHIDAPRHIFKGAPTLDQIAPDRFIGQGVIADIPAEGEEEISLARLQSGCPPLRRGDILFVATGWDRYFPGNDEAYYLGPYLSVEVAEWAVEQGVTMLGIDAMSLDKPPSRRGPDFRFPVHQCLIRNDVLVVENLANLRALAGQRVEVIALPLAIHGADGAPARVIARAV
jgi:arylformamidase